MYVPASCAEIITGAFAKGESIVTYVKKLSVKFDKLKYTEEKELVLLERSGTKNVGLD